jgi:hypothetical protein
VSSHGTSAARLARRTPVTEVLFFYPAISVTSLEIPERVFYRDAVVVLAIVQVL